MSSRRRAKRDFWQLQLLRNFELMHCLDSSFSAVWVARKDEGSRNRVKLRVGQRSGGRCVVAEEASSPVNDDVVAIAIVIIDVVGLTPSTDCTDSRSRPVLQLERKTQYKQRREKKCVRGETERAREGKATKRQEDYE